MTRPLGSALLIIVSALCFGQATGKPVTYRTYAVPLHQALDEISKQSGLTLFASEDLQDEPIIISVKNVTVKDLMDQIASTIAAEWKEGSKGEYELYRSDALVEKLENATIDDRTKSAVFAQQGLLKVLNPGDYTDLGLQKSAQSEAVAIQMIEDDPMTKRGYVDARPAEAILVRGPAHHALIDLMELMPAKEIAQLDPGKEIVYCSQPNPGEHALPEGSNDVIAEFIREQNVFADAYANARKKATANPSFGFLTQRMSPVTADKLRIVVVVNRSPFGLSSPTAHFYALTGDPTNNSRPQLIDSVQGFSRRSSADADKDYSDTLALAAKDTDVPLSKESQLLFDANRRVEKSNWGSLDMTPEFQDLLVNPDRRDPLSLCVSDCFLYFADTKNENLVAYPADAMLRDGFSGDTPGPLKLTEYLWDIGRNGMVLREDKGWISLCAIDPIGEWKRRMDRKFLGDCLREARDRGYISIETASALANSERSDEDSTMPQFYQAFATKFDPYLDRDRHLLRFYGSLSAQQVSNLQSGSTMTAGDLSSDQRARFQELISQGNAYGNLRFTSPNNAPSDQGAGDLRREPLEALPEGITQGTTISLKANTSDILFLDEKADDYHFVWPGTLDTIAYIVATKEMGKAKSNVGNPEGFHVITDIGWIAPGQQRKLDFTFDFGGSRTCSEALTELYCSPERWTVDTLPDDLKQKLADAVKVAKMHLAEMDSHQAPPPPAQPPR